MSSHAPGEASRQPNTRPFELLTFEDVVLEEMEALDGVPMPPRNDRTKERFEAAVDKRFLPRVALCLSGGGIRSATFSLGFLQAISEWYADKEKHSPFLGTMDFLSTVSGGGYIGSWLSRWIHREGRDRVLYREDGLRNRLAAPVSNLRASSSYLAPARGLSLDSTTLLAIYTRNLLLTWSVFLPLLAVILMIPRLELALLATADSARVGRVFLLVGLITALAAIRHVRRLPKSDPGESSQPITKESQQRTAPTAPQPMRTHSLTRRLGVPVLVCALLSLPWMLMEVSATDALSSSWRWYLLRGTAIVLALLVIATRVERTNVHLVEAFNRFRKIEGPGDGASGLVLISSLLVTSQLTLTLVDSWSLVTKTIVGPPLVCVLYCLGIVLWSAASSRWASKTHRESLSRMTAAIFTPAAIWLVGSWLVLKGPEVLLDGGGRQLIATSGLLGGVLAAAVGYYSDGEGDREAPERVSKLNRYVLPFAASVFGIVLVVVVSLVTTLILSSSQVQPLSSPYASVLKARQEKLDKVAKYESELKKQILRDPRPAANLDASGVTPESERACSTKAQPQDRCAEVSALSTVQRQAIEREFSASALSSLSKISASLMHLGESHADFVESAKVCESVLVPSGIAYLFKDDCGLAILPVFVATLALSIIASFFVGANRFSLHDLYGDRLIRAYLGAPRDRDSRRPNAYTGFDPSDNVPLHKLSTSKHGSEHDQQTSSSIADRDRNEGRPLHILQAALNVTRSSPNDPQRRLAAPFTFSRLHVGSRITKFRHSEWYGPTDDRVTLGRAMTISGAAVSPAMGYHSSKPVAFVLSFFNAALGWWLPNPKRSDQEELEKAEPPRGVLEDIRAVLGVASDDAKWVYLSDGGHFDNLGLYEMIRRRCRIVLVVDATEDSEYKFADLARTMRMIRSDLGVDVDFLGLHPEQETEPECPVFLANLRYPGTAGWGRLIYIKPVLFNSLPVDILEYARSRRDEGATFPHDSTTDQFFDEAQFESYRRLGEECGLLLRKIAPEWQDILGEDPPAAKRLDEELQRLRRSRGKTDASEPAAAATMTRSSSLKKLAAYPLAAVIGGTALTTAAASNMVSSFVTNNYYQDGTDAPPPNPPIQVVFPASDLVATINRIASTLTENLSEARKNRESVEAIKSGVDSTIALLQRLLEKPETPPNPELIKELLAALNELGTNADKIRVEVESLRRDLPRMLPPNGPEVRDILTKILGRLETVRAQIEATAPGSNVRSLP